MIDTGTESLPIVAIFMPFADMVCGGFEIDFPLKEFNTLSVGDNLVTTTVVTVATEVRHTRARIKCARARENKE